MDVVELRRHHDGAHRATPIGLTGKESQGEVLRRTNLMLEHELKQAKQALASYGRRKVFEDRVVEALREHLKDNPFLPQLPKPAFDKKDAAGTHEMMLVLSDAHVPEVVDPRVTMGIEYTPEIFAKRLAYIRDTVLRYRELKTANQPIKKLTVAMVGDMLSGDIHEELEVTNATPISETMVTMAYQLHEVGMEFAKAFPEVEWIVMPGNHARLTKKPRYKESFNNWEHVLGHFLKALANGAYQVVVPKSILHPHTVLGARVGLTHGHGVNVSSFAGIPFYSMRSRRDAIQALLRQLGAPQLDLLVMGHWHSLMYWESTGCDLFINGSVIGGTEYSVGRMYAAVDPVQGLLTFHEKHGLVDMSRINLGHIK
jgi:predicted phosphodiesterase